MNKNRLKESVFYHKNTGFGLLFIALLAVLYWWFFPQRTVDELYRKTLINPEVEIEGLSPTLTVTGEKVGGDLILRSDGIGYHFPEKLWRGKIVPDSLQKALIGVDSVVVWLASPSNPNILGLQAGSLFFDPVFGVADLNKMRLWVCYLLFALSFALLLEVLRRKLFSRRQS
jgi:hypothetical protein